jgi:hypothetical protein
MTGLRGPALSRGRNVNRWPDCRPDRSSHIAGGSRKASTEYYAIEGKAWPNEGRGPRWRGQGSRGGARCDRQREGLFTNSKALIPFIQSGVRNTQGQATL